MGNISLKSKYLCCVSDSNFYEEEDENTLEETSLHRNKENTI